MGPITAHKGPIPLVLDRSQPRNLPWIYELIFLRPTYAGELMIGILNYDQIITVNWIRVFESLWILMING